MELPLLDATEQASFTALSLSLSLSILVCNAIDSEPAFVWFILCWFMQSGLCSLVVSPDPASLITRFAFQFELLGQHN